MLPPQPPHQRTLPLRGTVPPPLSPASMAATSAGTHFSPVAITHTVEPPALPPATGTMVSGQRVYYAPTFGHNQARQRTQGGYHNTTGPAHIAANALSRGFLPASGAVIYPVQATHGQFTTAHNVSRGAGLTMAMPAVLSPIVPAPTVVGSDQVPTAPGHVPTVPHPVSMRPSHPTTVLVSPTPAPSTLSTRQIVPYHPTPASTTSTRGSGAGSPGSGWWTAIAWSIFVIGMATLALIFLL
jgi:hypothetical protein